VFTEQLVDGVEPWGGVREVWAAGSPDAAHGVDTSDSFDRGVASLEAHSAYIDGLGWDDFDPEEFLQSIARPTGGRLGAKYGAAFEVFPMGWGS
ncbi:MAG: PIG-L family deacetylase, partial [Actinomycetota bacterium]|nr:PIG-L family deacetylase [Actinomycetota bacterium]